ncbi:DNA repair and recombination protein RAD54 [Ceratobasidium sp. AG-Ba]|nr:DNA repair and recombination protein RAD54 [Ceratobasidium sp. AG-Ba]
MYIAKEGVSLFSNPQVLVKPFKSPAPSTPVARPQPQRKRKRVVYTEAGGSDSDSDSGGKNKKKKKRATDDTTYADADGSPAVNINRLFPTFGPPKPITGRFALPSITDKSGNVVPVVMSYAALGIRPAVKIPPRPLHDPMADHAIVLFDPTIDTRETDEERKEREKEEAAAKLRAEKEKALQEGAANGQSLFNPHKSLKELLGGGKETQSTVAPKVPVVIDPKLGKVLRPHQIEGVKFLYRCTTGMTVEGQYGCIMADEMGLGKTLQCIALLWTLLKQSPRGAGRGTIEKCIIACPASLVKNWANELVKWLGDSAPKTFAIDGTGTKADLIAAVRRWVQAKGRHVTLPVSYETLRTLCEELAGCEIGLMLCDEGHRLKNSENLTFKTLNELNCKRRVILSGTPIQNDLSEYFSLLNFANKDYLGTKNEFRKNFENAIIRGRDADASDKEKEQSLAKLRELSGRVQPFIIRRTNDLLSKYLPVKYEQVVFCALSPLQTALYWHFITSPEVKKLLRGVGSQPLKAIGMLKKLCNHPALLDLPNDVAGSEGVLPPGYNGGMLSAGGRGGGNLTPDCSLGGKFVVLERFLERIRRETNDKIVLISNYTQTMDLFEKMCRSKNYGCIRLDGTLSVAKRQKLVDRFNDPEGKEFVFLLSSKAGGCGINLIGANRLILFDPDWNPASDQQALARVWRDGQKKECFVYRFVSTGTIEEKIFQRQASKQALSSCVVDEKEDTERHFSGDELRKLFEFRENTLCETHETFKCKRCKNGKQFIKAPAMLYGDGSTWNHYTNPELKNNHDDLLRAEVGLPEVTFTFQYISH